MKAGTLTESICRKAATDLLDRFMVGAPEEIDLVELAWLAGQLRIEEGVLDTAEGRLVATERGGVIRVGRNVQPEGRRRFTIAHEIGHRRLHGPGIHRDSLAEFRMWTGGSKETEANIFAGELLMPAKLFAPLVPNEVPSLAFVDALAQRFRTSSLAAAVHFIEHTREPCALVASSGNALQWSRRSPTFEFRLRAGKLHAYTGAAEAAGGTKPVAPGMTRTPAGAWLEGFEPDGREDIWEDTRPLEAYGLVISLLWIKDELE